MNLCFLGTAASEGYPNFYCACDNCREARRLGGRNLRLRSALLVNDDLLLDVGPDLVASAQRLGLSLSRLQILLVTHRHEDHWEVSNFKVRKAEQLAVRPPRLAVFGPPQVIQAIQAAVTDPEKVLLDLRPVYPLETWQHGDYRFACYPANHGGGELECQFYSVDDGRRRLLYATDTGPLPEAAWQALSGQSFDCIVLEETMGYKEKAQHLGLASFLEQYHRFQKEGILRPGGRMVATHLSHQWNPVHDKLVSILEPQGVTVAYDGLTLEL